jgi:hypothetical protein
MPANRYVQPKLASMISFQPDRLSILIPGIEPQAGFSTLVAHSFNRAISLS